MKHLDPILRDIFFKQLYFVSIGTFEQLDIKHVLIITHLFHKLQTNHVLKSLIRGLPHVSGCHLDLLAELEERSVIWLRQSKESFNVRDCQRNVAF